MQKYGCDITSKSLASASAYILLTEKIPNEQQVECGQSYTKL